MVGVFIFKGMGISIPAGGLALSVGEDGEPSASLSLHLGLDMWPIWLNAAIDQAVKGREVAKEIAVESSKATPNPERQGELLMAECTAGMVSVGAAAFALDNFYTVIKEFVPNGKELEERWSEKGTARHKRVSESMRRTFAVSNYGGSVLRKDIEEIFKYRDWAVHPPGGHAEPLFHPEMGVGVEWRFSAFGAASANVATRAAASFIGQCVQKPRPGNNALTAWCEARSETATRVADRAEECLGMTVEGEPTA